MAHDSSHGTFEDRLGLDNVDQVVAVLFALLEVFDALF
jgi:hypothetical protein